MIKRMINGKIIEEETLKLMAEKLYKHKYNFFNPRCSCEKHTKMSFNQAYDGLSKNKFSNLDRFKCPICAKKITPSIVERRKKYFKIKLGSYKGKLLWKSKERLTREEAMRALKGSNIYLCPFCGKEPSWQAVIFKWPFQDNGNTRTFYIPDDYVCCNNSHSIRTKIIYKGKAYKFNASRDVTSYLMSEMNIIRCKNCNELLNEYEIKYLIGSHDSSNWIVKDKEKIFNYDDCNEKFTLCTDCRTKLFHENQSKRVSYNNMKYILNDIIKYDKLNNYYNELLIQLKNKESNKFHMYSKLYKEFLAINVEPKLYFSYLTTLHIDYQGNGKHHLIPVALQKNFNNVRVCCNNYQHLFLHFLLALDVYKSYLSFKNKEFNVVYQKLILGFICMYRMHNKYFENERDWEIIQNKLKRIFYIHKL